MLSRLKFDLSEIINEKLNYIPNYIWESKTTTFCDLQMAGGQYIKEIVNKLREFGHSDENIKSRIFGFSENEFYLAVIQGDSSLIGVFKVYNENIDMKFDVIVGNPPYQDDNGASTSKAIWPQFVKKSMSLLNNDGYLCYIHPSSWRQLYGSVKDIQNLLLSKQILYLNLNDYKRGRELFGVQTDFDMYILKNTPKNRYMTLINDCDDIDYNYCLDDVQIIPNSNIDKFYSLISNSGTVNFINDSMYHTQRNWISNSKNSEYKYPCVYSITKSEGIKFKYSNLNNRGHFGLPKVIWTNGSSSYPIIDETGEYGLTEFSYAIVDDVKNLKYIQTALMSDRFLKEVMSFRGLGNIYDKKIISTLKKDFWKEFIND